MRHIENPYSYRDTDATDSQLQIPKCRTIAPLRLITLCGLATLLCTWAALSLHPSSYHHAKTSTASAQYKSLRKGAFRGVSVSNTTKSLPASLEGQGEASVKTVAPSAVAAPKQTQAGFPNDVGRLTQPVTATTPTLRPTAVADISNPVNNVGNENRSVPPSLGPGKDGNLAVTKELVVADAPSSTGAALQPSAQPIEEVNTKAAAGKTVRPAVRNLMWWSSNFGVEKNERGKMVCWRSLHDVERSSAVLLVNLLLQEKLSGGGLSSAAKASSSASSEAAADQRKNESHEESSSFTFNDRRFCSPLKPTELSQPIAPRNSYSVEPKVSELSRFEPTSTALAVVEGLVQPLLSYPMGMESVHSVAVTEPTVLWTQVWFLVLYIPREVRSEPPRSSNNDVKAGRNNLLCFYFNSLFGRICWDVSKQSIAIVNRFDGAVSPLEGSFTFTSDSNDYVLAAMRVQSMLSLRKVRMKNTDASSNLRGRRPKEEEEVEEGEEGEDRVVSAERSRLVSPAQERKFYLSVKRIDALDATSRRFVELSTIEKNDFTMQDEISSVDKDVILLYPNETVVNITESFQSNFPKDCRERIYLSEILVVGSDLTDDEANRMFGYFAMKYHFSGVRDAGVSAIVADPDELSKALKLVGQLATYEVLRFSKNPEEVMADREKKRRQSHVEQMNKGSAVSISDNTGDRSGGTNSEPAAPVVSIAPPRREHHIAVRSGCEASDAELFGSTPVDTYVPPGQASEAEKALWLKAVTALKTTAGSLSLGGEKLRVVLEGQAREMAELRHRLFCKYY